MAIMTEEMRRRMKSLGYTDEQIKAMEELARKNNLSMNEILRKRLRGRE